MGGLREVKSVYEAMLGWLAAPDLARSFGGKDAWRLRLSFGRTQPRHVLILRWSGRPGTFGCPIDVNAYGPRQVPRSP
jgi:hypothetical protein